MVSHKQIWSAIDALAARHGYTASGLARAAGLDATAFNKSKRSGPAGKQRWPSTESIAKILAATGSSFDAFASLTGGRRTPAARTIPLIGLAQAAKSGVFDGDGFPTGSGWENTSAPDVDDDNAYALKVSGDSLAPVYGTGTVIIVSPEAEVRRGDRVVVRTSKGEMMIREVSRKAARKIELKPVNSSQPSRNMDAADVAFMARIVWASQ